MMETKFLPEAAAIAAQQQQQQQQQHQQQLQQQQQQLQQSSSDSKSFSVSEENRHYLKVFIQTYHNLPILWDTTLRDYSNRDKRAEAYEQLVPIYRFLKRDANLLDVKKKINTLRTNYRKELKMIEMARKQGTVYHPRCWTYYELDFLRNAEKFLAIDPNHNIKTEPTNSSTSPFAMFNESTHQGNFLEISPYGFRMNNGTSPPPSISQMFQKSFGQINNVPPHEQKTQALANHNTPPVHHVQNGITPAVGHNGGAMLYEQQVQSPSTPHHQPMNVSGHNKRLKLSSHAMPATTTSPTCICSATNFGEEEALTRTWAYKLKRLTREQRLYAEKFINDILFEAETGTLHRGSMQLNAFEPYVRFEESQAEDDASNNSHDNSQSPNVMASNSPSTGHGPANHSSNSHHSQSHEVGDVKNIDIQDNRCMSGVDNENSRGQNAAFQSYN